jgi:hypothetical protein
LTVCQLHSALAALVRSWWLNGERTPRKVIEKIVKKLARTQRRNAAARKSHTKQTRRRLRELGIKLTELKRCQWGPT